MDDNNDDNNDNNDNALQVNQNKVNQQNNDNNHSQNSLMQVGNAASNIACDSEFKVTASNSPSFCFTQSNSPSALVANHPNANALMNGIQSQNQNPNQNQNNNTNCANNNNNNSHNSNSNNSNSNNNNNNKAISATNNSISTTSSSSSSSDVMKQRLKQHLSTDRSVFIVDWVDYSKRYGMGYICNNGQTGIYFNDSSKILAKNNGQISYISDGKCQYFNKTQYPSHIDKKMILLKHFESYLHSKLSANQTAIIEKYQNLHSEHMLENVYLKNWTATQHATLFRLSNKTVQINFNDHSRIVICSRTQHVIYTNKLQKRRTLLLSDVLQTRQKDLRKRMRYMQDILKHLLGIDH